MSNKITVTEDGDLYRATVEGFPDLVEWAETEQVAIQLAKDSVATLREIRQMRKLEEENNILKEALTKIASGRHGNQLLLCDPPKDPAAEIAKTALAKIKGDYDG